MENAIIIFVRNPEAGKVKTRLAAVLGTEAALSIYKKLLQHTLEITDVTNADKFVFYAEEIVESDMWEKAHYFKERQASGDLGHRMCSAFEYVLSKGYKEVCIIGSDCYELTPAIIQQAFVLLKTNDIVIGPAKDGGYYLLGMKHIHPELFKNKSWSTNTVCKDTMEDIERLSITYEQLPLLSDVDEAADVPAEWLTELKR